MDVGEILVGFYKSIEIPLINDSPCSVSFCLSVQQRLLEDNPVYDPDAEPSGILLCWVHSCFLLMLSNSLVFLFL